ncbi:MAG: DUF2079 domain-containing protein [Anaerolineae bacterium]|nr:DUF2079 domain-containing protein [Anaerolineae bacterium]
MVSKIQRQRSISPALIGLLLTLIAYNIFFIAYNLQKHATFQTAGFDLGIWGQKVWNMAHGRPFLITAYHEIGSVSLGDHVDPIGLLFAPLYALFPAPQTLIIIQVIIVSTGAIPVYWLAQTKLHSHIAGLVFAVIYLLFPALQGAITFDVHGITLAAPLLAWALWALFKRHYRFFMVMAVLAMACQEDVPLLIFMMGLYLAAIQRNWRIGGLTVVLSLFWFVMANFIIIPAFSLAGNNLHFYRYQALGDNLGEIMTTMLTRPDIVIQQIFSGDKQFYWLRLTMPTTFIALLDPLTLLMALPALLINTLSTYPPTYQLDRFHSSAPIVPFVVVAGINGLSRLIKFATPKFKHIKPAFLQNSLLMLMLLVTLIYQAQFGHTPLGRYFDWPVVTGHHQKAEQMLRLIPSQAAVAAQNNLVPRLSQRQWIFILPKVSHQGKPADYLALDMQSSLTPYRYVEEYCAQLAKFVDNPDYGLIFSDDGLLLFKRNVSDIVTFKAQPPCP